MGKVNLVRPTGDVVTVDEADVADLESLGYRRETEEETYQLAASEAERKYYESPEQQFYTGLEGLASGATIGASDLFLKGEDTEKRAQYNPGTRMLTEIGAGFVPGLLSGGTGTAARLAQLTPAGRLAQKGRQIEKTLGGLKGAVAGGAFEGFVGGVGAEATRSTLADDPFSVEAALASGTLSGVLGGGAGALAHGFEKVGARAADRLAEPGKLKAQYGAEADALAKNIDEATGADMQRLEQLREQYKATGLSDEELLAKMRGEHEAAGLADTDALGARRAEYGAADLADEEDLAGLRAKYGAEDTADAEALQGLRTEYSDEGARLRGEYEAKGKQAAGLREEMKKPQSPAAIAAEQARIGAARKAARDTLISDDSFNSLRSSMDDMSRYGEKMVKDADDALKGMDEQAKLRKMLGGRALPEKASPRQAAASLATVGEQVFQAGEKRVSGQLAEGALSYADDKAWAATKSRLRRSLAEVREAVAHGGGTSPEDIKKILGNYHSALTEANQRFDLGVTIPELLKKNVDSSVAAVEQAIDINNIRNVTKQFPTSADDFLAMAPNQAEKVTGAVDLLMKSQAKDLGQFQEQISAHIDDMLKKAGLEVDGTAGEKLRTLYNVGRSDSFQAALKNAGASLDNVAPIRQRLQQIEAEQADLQKRLAEHGLGGKTLKDLERESRGAAGTRQAAIREAEDEAKKAATARGASLKEAERDAKKAAAERAAEYDKAERAAKARGREGEKQISKAERAAARDQKARMQYLKKEQKRLEKELNEQLEKRGHRASPALDYMGRRVGATVGRKAMSAMGIGGIGMMLGGDAGAMMGFAAMSNFAGAKAAVMGRLTQAAAKWAPKAGRVVRRIGPQVDPLLRTYEGIQDDPALSRREAYKKRTQELADLAAVGKDRIYAVSAQLEQEGHPGFAMALNATANKALQQALDAMPKDDGKTPWGFGSLWEPTPAQMEVFGRVSRAIFEPMASFDAISSGDIHPAEVKSLQTAWPELYNTWKGEMIKNLSQPGVTDKLSRQDWSELSIALDMTLSPTQRPEWIAAQQQMFAQRAEKKQGAPPGQAGRPPGPGPNTTAAQAATER